MVSGHKVIFRGDSGTGKVPGWRRQHPCRVWPGVVLAGHRLAGRDAGVSRPCLTKADLMEALIASMGEAVRIIAGEVPPSRVQTTVDLAARAVARAARQLEERPC